MKALGLKLGLIIMVLVLLPGIAFAKGPGLDHVTLDGPGIGAPLHVEKHYPYLLDDAIFMHVFGSSSRRDISRDEPKADDLGPKFLLRYHMVFGPPIEVDFYPYTDRGPVAYAAPGQSVPVPVGYSGEDVKFPVNPGWFNYRPGMVDLLQDEGLPTANEINESAPTSGFFVAAFVALVSALAVVGLLGHRQRRNARVLSQVGI